MRSMRAVFVLAAVAACAAPVARADTDGEITGGTNWWTQNNS